MRRGSAARLGPQMAGRFVVALRLGIELHIGPSQCGVGGQVARCGACPD